MADPEYKFMEDMTGAFMRLNAEVDELTKMIKSERERSSELDRQCKAIANKANAEIKPYSDQIEEIKSHVAALEEDRAAAYERARHKQAEILQTFMEWMLPPHKRGK